MKREMKRRDHRKPKKAKDGQEGEGPDPPAHIDLPQHVQETHFVVLSHPVCGTG